VALVLMVLGGLVADLIPGRVLPRRAALEGPLVVSPHLDTQADDPSPHELVAGGHPFPDALEVIELDLEDAGEEFPDRSQEGEDTPEDPDLVDPEPGPAEGLGDAPRDAVRLSFRSERFAILRFVKPRYPADAEVYRSEGRVRIHALVDRSGDVVEVRSEADEGLLPSCVAAAESATRQWRFTPLTENGVAVPFWVEIPYDFRLGSVALDL
jgi:TonB family protein